MPPHNTWPEQSTFLCELPGQIGQVACEFSSLRRSCRAGITLDGTVHNALSNCSRSKKCKHDKEMKIRNAIAAGVATICFRIFIFLRNTERTQIQALEAIKAGITARHVIEQAIIG